MHARTVTAIEGRPAGLAERIVLGLAERLERGGLILHLPDGRTRVFQGAKGGPEAEMALRHPRVFRRLLTGGEIGLAESYMAGEWESPDLTALIALEVLARIQGASS